MLAPDLHVASVTCIEVGWLRARGVVGVLVDADDTLVARARGRERGGGRGDRIEPEARAWVAQLVDAGLRVAILSNGTPGRVAALGALLGVPTVAWAGKPFGFAFRRALRTIGTTPATTAMVGDQLFTDVLGARWAGLTSILVTPLTPGRHAHTRVARRVERWVLRGGNRGGPVDR